MNWLAFINATSLAIQTIRAHKMRAVLTVLGVVMGTGTIIGVGAILTGFDANITNILRSFGPNSIIIYKFPGGLHGPPTPAERARKDLVYDNVVDLRGRCEACETVSPNLFIQNSTIQARYKGNDIYGANLMGVEESYADQGQADMHEGRFITEQDGRRRAQVAVIGADIAKSLYANVNPIGKTITVDGHEFEVIGSMNKPAASFFGQDDMRVLLPFATMHKNYPSRKDIFIVVGAREGQLAKAMDEIRVVLRIARHVKYSKPDDFALSTAEQMVSDFRQITSMVALVMVVLSSVGLLVGGIGVMNIMLVSVTGADQGDRCSQSHWSPQIRHHSAVPTRSCCANWVGRRGWNYLRLAHCGNQPACLFKLAGDRSALGGGARVDRLGRYGTFLWDMARE